MLLHDDAMCVFHVYQGVPLYTRTVYVKKADKTNKKTKNAKKLLAVPGFEPGSSGSQPLMLTTTLYHHGCALSRLGKFQSTCFHRLCFLPSPNKSYHTTRMVDVVVSLKQRHALIAQLGER